MQSLKPLLFEARLDVGEVLGAGGAPDAGGAPQAVFGAKACDLASLAVLDFVFADETADPFYARNRRRTLIVSSDCTAFKEVCFCTLVGGKPYPEKGFDLNLSPA